jgi:drug/metabolite transporter (DMT)-like permease
LVVDGRAEINSFRAMREAFYLRGVTSASPASAPRAALPASTLGLYAVIVWCWGSSWYALHHQLGVVAPEVALVWRFLLAAMLMFGWCLLDRSRLRFGLAEHARFLLLGLCIFSTNFLLFYYGGQALASGLLAVVFSTASIFNLVLGALIFRQPIAPRVAAGALIGFAGIALIYWPEIAQVSGAQVSGGGGFDRTALVGLLLCLGGTLSFCLGNMVSTANQRRGLPVKSANAWGMLYGTAFLALLAAAQDKPFIVDWRAPYLVSLIYLVVVSTVIAFWTYLTLLGRVGAGRAGYATVLFPVLALAISSLLENYVWTGYAFAGLALVALGNLLVLRR